MNVEILTQIRSVECRLVKIFKTTSSFLIFHYIIFRTNYGIFIFESN